MNAERKYGPSFVQSTQLQGSNDIAARAAQALTSTLVNPYGQSSWSQSSVEFSPFHANRNISHWNQPFTPSGYPSHSAYALAAPPSRLLPPGPSPYPSKVSSRPSGRPFAPSQAGPWFVPGNQRCTHQGCTFKASAQSVEIHMMDRHLIFPPDWNKRNHQNTWDGDASLKGKEVHVFGTSIMLNTPEAIDAWISERRQKWPTAQRVTSKRVWETEAIERGEIQMEELRRSSKRRRKQTQTNGQRTNRAQAELDVPLENPPARLRPSASFNPLNFRPADGTTRVSNGEDSDDEDGPPDEVRSTKKSMLTHPSHDYDTNAQNTRGAGSVSANPNCRPLKPKLQPNNPFAAKRSLLRDLLLPEIRHTISHMSQAMHFIVENDFFEGFELKPGDAKSVLIQVIDQNSSTPNEL